MSLYEALDNFVGAGVLACAGMVGAEMPRDQMLDGSAFSRQLRAQRLGDGFGGALDSLAHAIWMVQEQRGFSHSVSEAHALALGRLMSVIRFDRQELISILASAPMGGKPAVSGQYGLGIRLADAWIAKAVGRGALPQPGLIDDVVSFLLGRMFCEVVEEPELLEEMRPVLFAYRDGLVEGNGIVAEPQPALQPEVSALNSAVNALRAADAGRAATSHPSSHSTWVPTAPAVRSAAATREALVPAVVSRMPDGARTRFQAILSAQPLSDKQRQARLIDLANWLSATVEHLRRPSNEPAAVLKIKAEAADALDAGELERAMELLKVVRERLRDERRGTERRIAEELENLRLNMLEEAAATVRLGELAMARFDFAAAADFFADAAGQLPAKETGLEFDYRQRHAEALASLSEQTFDARVLEAAAQAFRTCRRLLVRERDPGSWVRTSVGLGDMLTALAAHSKQPELTLEEATVSFAEAVEVIDRATKPMQWAVVQLSHATALIALGELRDRARHWKHAASLLTPALEVVEARGATDLAAAAREKLRTIAVGISEDAGDVVPEDAGEEVQKAAG